MHGEVTTYNSTTGVLVVDINHHTGTGTYTSWIVNVGGVTPATVVSWGDIVGTLGTQSDLSTALNAKLEITTAATTYLPLAGGTLTQPVSTSGSPTAFTLTGAAHTTLTLSTEATDVNFNLSRTVQFATGALTTQRAMRIQAPTYGFVGASTITTASTLSISGPPVAGTNATITNAYALNVESGPSAFGNTVFGTHNFHNSVTMYSPGGHYVFPSSTYGGNNFAGSRGFGWSGAGEIDFGCKTAAASWGSSIWQGNQFILSGGVTYMAFQGSYVGLGSSMFLCWTSGDGRNGLSNGQAESRLGRMAANTLGIHGSTTAQTFQLYNTYTSSTSYETLNLKGKASANFEIGPENGSAGGTLRGLTIGGYSAGTTTIAPWLTFTNAGAATFAGAVSASNLSGTNTGDQSLSGLVPYTGATGSVDLGAYTLTGANLTLRNGTTATSAIVTKTYTSSTSFEELRLGTKGLHFEIGVAVGSAGGTVRNLRFASYETAAPTTQNLWAEFVGSTGSFITYSGSNIVYRFGDITTGSVVNYRKARGTILLPSAVQLGDNILQEQASGYRTTGYSGVAAQIAVIATEPWTDDANGTKIVFSTTANVSTTLTSRLSIENDGTIGFTKAAGFGSETVNTPSGTTQTITLDSANHQTLTLTSATGTVTATLTVPTRGSSSGTIIVKQHASAAKDITWAVSSGTITWMGTEPDWAADAINAVRIVSWRYNGSVMYLMSTDVGA
jgi:hypothetical protein